MGVDFKVFVHDLLVDGKGPGCKVPAGGSGGGILEAVD